MRDPTLRIRMVRSYIRTLVHSYAFGVHSALVSSPWSRGPWSKVQGDASKAKRVLGWQPRVTFRQLIEMMVDADLSGQGGRGGEST